MNYPQNPEQFSQPQKSWPASHKILTAIGAVLALIAVIGFAGAAAGSGNGTTKTVTVPGPTVTATATAPAPTVTRTATVRVTQTATVAPPPLTVARYSGTSNWNSPQFTVTGDSPVLTVAYTYSGNQDSNFAADLTNGSDDQQIANDIGTSASRTTTLYPDTSSGDTYHLTVMATGSWSVTITEAG